MPKQIIGSGVSDTETWRDIDPENDMLFALGRDPSESAPKTLSGKRPRLCTAPCI
jgi:hypothetical protein